MNNQKIYRCVECKSLFDDSQLKADMSFCPSCGGHLKDGPFKKYDRAESAGTSEETKQDSNFEEMNEAYGSRKNRFHTHYENLKVARNAPPEVIRAAYRVLAQKYHPDFNPGSAEAIRIMKIINTSYEVLSDPVKRRAHDHWIGKCEQPYDESARTVNQPRPEATSRPVRPEAAPDSEFLRSTPTSDVRARRRNSKINIIWLLLGLLFIFGGIYDLRDTYSFLKSGTRTYIINANGMNYESKDSVRNKASSRNTVILYGRDNTSENKTHKRDATVGWALIVLGTVSVVMFSGLLKTFWD
jgi:curved DNA-binding protein CbpA/DNA-directed RNA polymerase subunit RPC12/RpoP